MDWIALVLGGCFRLSNAMNEKEKLDIETHIAAWHLVWLVERGHVTDRTSIKCAVYYLEAYADLYSDENCRYRAQKLRDRK